MSSSRDTVPTLPVNEGQSEDEFVRLLYAVYCTSEIPTETLTEFVSKSRGWGEAFIVTKEDSHFLDYKQATRFPLEQPLQSPFLAWSLDAIAAKFDQQTKGLDGSRYGTANFVILDEETVKDAKTCMIVERLNRGTMALRAEFEVAINCFSYTEVMAWGFDEYPLDAFYNQNRTITKEAYEKELDAAPSKIFA